jgi:hypothetical protein
MKSSHSQPYKVDANDYVKQFNFNAVVEDLENHKGGWRFHRQRTERTEPNATKIA